MSIFTISVDISSHIAATLSHIQAFSHLRVPHTCNTPIIIYSTYTHNEHLISTHDHTLNGDVCGTLKCENAAICEKVAKCEKNSTLNVKIDAICEKITLNVKKLGSLNVSNISTLNVLKSTLYVQTLF